MSGHARRSGRCQGAEAKNLGARVSIYPFANSLLFPDFGECFLLIGFWKGGHPITQSFQVSGLMVLRADAPLPIPVA
jgi:hypothetical protein